MVSKNVSFLKVIRARLDEDVLCFVLVRVMLGKLLHQKLFRKPLVAFQNKFCKKVCKIQSTSVWTRDPCNNKYRIGRQSQVDSL